MKEEWFCGLSIIVPEILVHDTCLYKKTVHKFLLAAKDDCETLYVEMECLENFIRDLT